VEAWSGPFGVCGDASQNLLGQQKTPRAKRRERFDNSNMRLLPLHKKKEGASGVHWVILYRHFVVVASKTVRNERTPLP
jgi:hypothetical protein